MMLGLVCWAALASGPGSLPGLAGDLQAGRSATLEVAAADRPRDLAIVIALAEPGRLRTGVPIAASVAFGATRLAKVLHQGDPDVTWTVRLPSGIPARVGLDAPADSGPPAPFAIRAVELGPGVDGGVAFEVEPNDEPATATRFALGQTIYASADDRPDLPIGEAPTPEESAAGVDWFAFDFDSPSPKLAFVALEFVDRDVPPDVRVFRLVDGKPVEHTEGIDPQSLQRERPPRPGANKFTTRLLAERGTYHIRVDACHPDYQLRVKLFDPPPYLKPEQVEDPEAVASAARAAIRTAMDFQLLAGDSWHANTPRKGHAVDRVANPHHETATCIACHPTHFTTQSALAANAAGYKVEQPFALQFLAERLYNNPVPFHGHPDALWARMIPAPANVLGRMSTILQDYEGQIAGQPRDNTHRGISEFLKLYYDGRNTIPPDESNGNNPVSRYKVAADAWRQLDAMAKRAGDPRHAATRDLVADLLPTGEPTTTRDLAAQTIGFCRIDPQRYAGPIAANVERLLALQRPDGHWSPKFDPKSPTAEMQTGESLDALALAGLPVDHPAIRKGVIALLLRQEAFGGWLDAGPHEGFNTPFRETQWALIALAKLYPAPTPAAKGWRGPLGPQPLTIVGERPAAIVGELERIWDEPGDPLHAEIVARLDDPSPVVRLAACQTLARVGVGSAIGPLSARLGDESKGVGRAAAEALRRIGNRINGANRPGATDDQRRWVAAMAAALRSPDDRTRRGATRVFAAHFREISQESALADVLIERLDDADPVAAMQAIKGLWRWWYWRADPATRGRIEDALLDGLDRPGRHPWVRRNLIEALYIIGDENIRYLYKNWAPALAMPADRDKVRAGQLATTDRLAGKYVAALRSGSPLRREGVLRAMSEFHERTVQGGRVGNDVEPILFEGEAQPALASALAELFGDPDPTIRRLALQGLVTLRGRVDPELARAILRRRGDGEAPVREWAGTMAREFPVVPKAGEADPATLAVIDELLANPQPDPQAAALALIRRIGPLSGPADRSLAVRDRLAGDAPAIRIAAIDALGAFPALLADPASKPALSRALADPDVGVRSAALRLALDRPAIATRSAVRTALEDGTPAHRIALLAEVGSAKGRAADLQLVGVVGDSVVDGDAGVREKALQVIQQHPTLVANPAVEAALRELSRSENARHREIAAALLKSGGKSSGGEVATDVLDPAFFAARILPILEAKGEDGQNCIGCHRSHTIFKLAPPDQGRTWSPAAARANFRSALRVVDLANPSASLLLAKPTWEAADEAEAQNDKTKKAHAGGIRFEAGTSAEYQTLLDWINGARLTPGVTPRASRE